MYKFTKVRTLRTIKQIRDMETDPIVERREQEARLAKEKNLRNVMYLLIVVAVLLAAALAFIWSQKASLINDLEIEKQELT